MQIVIDIPEEEYRKIQDGRAGVSMMRTAIKNGTVLPEHHGSKDSSTDDCISRQQAIYVASGFCHPSNVAKELAKLPPVTPQPKTGHCKDCKYFEYDSVANVDGIPLIVAHEFCSKWGDGCKTKEDGYCFLFKPQERSDKG